MNSWQLYIFSGVLVTLKYALLSAIIGIFFGSVIAIARLSRNLIICNLAKLYISIIRGTPLIVQISIVFFAIPGVFNIDISATVAGLIAFSMNSSGYLAEVVRGGILSIDKGQFEAAKSLSIPQHLMMRDIILPQVFRNIAPSLVNEMINLVKESAIISVIGEADIMRRSQIVAASTYDFFSPLMFAALCYYLIVLTLSTIAKYIEDRFRASYK